MSIKINYNASAILANNALNINDNKLTASLERLSSGYKINRAKDNAAGLAISRRMNAQIKGLNTAKQEAMDGVSVIEIADGALAEVHDILQRMNELSVKASNGTITDDDRASIQQEISALAEEVDRIGETTEYNSQKLFTGKYDLKGYTSEKSVKVDYYPDSMTYGKYKLPVDPSTKPVAKINSELKFEIEDGYTTLKSVGGSTANKVFVEKPDSTVEEYTVSGDVYHLKFTGKNGDEFLLDIASLTAGKEVKDENGNITGYNPVTFAGMDMDLTGLGAMTFQVGANEGQTVDIRFQKLSMETLGFKNQDTDLTSKMILDVSTEKGAKRALSQIDEAISIVTSMRSKLGAKQNRLEHTETNLSTSSDNVTAAYSRIMDTDMAEEMTNYSNLQIVSQAATAILAQTNERPSQMLQLLQ